MFKMLSALLAVLVLFSAFTVYAEDTVYISSAEELCALSARVAAGDRMAGINVVLTADINLSENFLPIGADTSAPFSGVFDGDGHFVYGLKVTGDAYCGLFGCVTDGTVKNLNIENAEINGNDYSGILVGRLYAYKGDATVENCNVSGTVNGNSYVGGIAGMLCAAAFDKSADAAIKSSAASCTVNGNIYVGGITGCAEARGNDKTATVLVDNCVSKGSVSADGSYGTMAGGICGALSAKDNGGNAVSELNNSISYAAVFAENLAAGGVCGALGSVGEYSASAITNTTAAGMVTGGAKVGGFCGKAETDGGNVGFENCVAASYVVGEDIESLGFGSIDQGCTRVENRAEVDMEGYAVADLNLDGEIDSLDAAAVLKINAELAIAGVNGDANGDGTIDSLDAAQILKFDVGLISEL